MLLMHLAHQIKITHGVFVLKWQNKACLFLNREDVNMTIMLDKYFLELDFSVTRRPLMCTSCYESLQCCFSFINNCLHIEEKIIEYCEIQETNSKGQIDLSKMLYITSDYEPSRSHNSSLTAVKIEKECCEQLELKYVEIKNENLIEVEEGLDVRMDIKIETNQSDCDRFEDNLLLLQPNTKLVRMDKEVTHKSFLETTIYNCEMCEFQTKYKKNLKRHMLTHESFTEVGTFICEICKFQTKYKVSLKRHMLVHKSIAEVRMYSCAECSYYSKHKKDLHVHMLIHRPTSEVTMYKCEICEFETKHRHNLKKHVLIHRNISEVPMYMCKMCEFQTKYKGSLKEHVLIHKKIPRTTMYKCELCKFQTKHKRSIQRHVLTHRTPYR